jgi:signal recognition particle GTPase
MEINYEDLLEKSVEKSVRGLLEEFNLNENIRTELLKFILAGHSLERYGKISDQTKASIKLRINSNEFIKDNLIEINKAKLNSKEKPPACTIDEEINEILVKLKVKDSIRESLLKEILDKGISSIETSDIASKTKTKLKEALNSSESLRKHFSTEKNEETVSKELIIRILVESDIQDDENLYERISRSILDIGINGLSEFEQDLSATEMKSLKEQLEPFIRTESNESNLNEANDELPKNEDEFENYLKNSYQINLDNLRQDYLSMPESAERIILNLLYDINSKLINSLESNETIEIDLNDIKQQLDHLKQRLKVEELTYISVDHFFMHLRNEDWKALSEELSRVLKQLRPLDIHEIQRLVNEAEICAEMIKDENVVLFLGDTGAGKSTHIHFLAGSTMVQTRIKGLNHIMPTEIKNPALKKVSTSPFAKSETRFISAVPIKISELDGVNDERFVLCDTPGFEDTSGAEVDIANGYSIVKAVKGCKSVRIVLLISYKSMGDKLTGVKNLAHILVQMVSGLKGHMKAFSYYFSKFPEQDRSTINAMLKDLKSKMNSEFMDPSFKLFFDDMVYKTRNNKQISIDLINDMPGQYLDDLWDGASICEPDEVFKVSITEKSKAVLKGLCFRLFFRHS